MKHINNQFKLLLIIVVLVIIAITRYSYDSFIAGEDPWKKFYSQELYSRIPYLQMINATHLKEAKNNCRENGGVWKLTITCGKENTNKSYFTPEDYTCYKVNEDGGKPCRSSDKCKGYCRFNDAIIQPLTGICTRTDEPSCCNDKIENQNNPDFMRCEY